MEVRVVTGHFGSLENAEQALAELDRAGFTDDEVSYMSRAEDTSTLQQRLEGKVGNNSHTVLGTAAGGVSGMLLGLAAVALPGVGPFLASGSLIAALVGAGVGAATGGLVGALADMGLPEAEAEAWAEKMQQGGALIVIRTTPEDVSLASGILRECGAYMTSEVPSKPVLSA